VRSIVLLATLLLPALAAAQSPQPGTTSGAAPARLPPINTPAPVPDVAPGVPATGSASVAPEQVAPSGATAGPANATPLSSTPSGQLPSDQGLPFGRNQTGGAGSATPNLSRWHGGRAGANGGVAAGFVPHPGRPGTCKLQFWIDTAV